MALKHAQVIGKERKMSASKILIATLMLIHSAASLGNATPFVFLEKEGPNWWTYSLRLKEGDVWCQ